MNVVFIIGSERLYSDLSRKYANSTPLSYESVSVIRLDKSGGCVDCSEAHMKALRHAQIRAYFFGHGEAALAPHSQSASFDELNIFKISEGTLSTFSAMSLNMHNPQNWSTKAYYAGTDMNFGGYQNDNPYGNAADADIYERITPSNELVNKLLAITTAGATDAHGNIRDASVKGYMYVADVDEAKKRVKLLSPQPGHVPSGALVMGSWPEDVPSLLG